RHSTDRYCGTQRSLREKRPCLSANRRSSAHHSILSNTRPESIQLVLRSKIEVSWVNTVAAAQANCFARVRGHSEKTVLARPTGSGDYHLKGLALRNGRDQ